MKYESSTTVFDGYSEEDVQSVIHALLRYRQLARSNDQNLTFTWMQYLALDRDFDWSAEIDAQLQRLDAKQVRSEEHTSELQSRGHLVCRLLLEKKKQQNTTPLA